MSWFDIRNVLGRGQRGQRDQEAIEDMLAQRCITIAARLFKHLIKLFRLAEEKNLANRRQLFVLFSYITSKY